MASAVSLVYSPYYTVPPEVEEPSLAFGAVALGGVDLVQSSSLLTRNIVGLVNTVQQRDNPVSFSALGFISVFSLVGNILSFQEGWQESALMKRIGDGVGRVLANLKIVKSGLQTMATVLFVPVRAFNIAAYTTASTSLSLISTLLGRVGGALFGGAGCIIGVGKAIEVVEVLSFSRELKAVYVDCVGTEQDKASLCLHFLQQKLQISYEEELEIESGLEEDPILRSPTELQEKVQELKNALLDKKRSILERLISKKCVAELESVAGGENATEVVQAVFKENDKIFYTSLAMLTCCLAGVVAAVILPWLGGTHAMMVVAGAIDMCLAAVWFGMDLERLQAAFSQHMVGRWDLALLSACSLLCIGSLSVAAVLEEGIVLHAITGGLGIVWLVINLLCYLHARQAERSQIQEDSPYAFDHIFA